MFLKPFRVKSHTQLKTSDKKRLRTLLAQQFHMLSEEDVSQLIPLKDDVSTMKLFSYKGDPVLVYLCGNEPLLLSIENRTGTVLLPTLYLCWQFPSTALAPVFVTHCDVLPRLQQGADLMMPGVVHQGQLTQHTFGQFEGGSAAVVMTTDGAVVAVGTTALSSTDLYMAGGHGKAVMVAHVLGDNLWAHGSKTLPRTLAAAGASASSPSTSENNVVVEAAPSSTAAGSSSSPPTTPSYSSIAAGSAASGSVADINAVIQKASASSSGGDVADINGQAQTTSAGSGSGSGSDVSCSSGADSSEGLDKLQLQDSDVVSAPPASPQVLSSGAMDGVLLHCFLKAVQQSKGALPLPLLTSSFYRLHVLPACPDNQTLDIKRTSFKKLSKFLKVMEEKGVVQVTEYPKGVENITNVNYLHEDVTSFRYNKSETTPKPVEGSGPVFVPPTMEDVYQVSGDTIEFFRACGKSKGEVMNRSEVRECVTDYVRRKKLVDNETKLVNLEPPLHGAVIAPKEGLVRQLKWDQVFSRLLGRMAPAVRVQRPGQADIVKKGKIEPIEMVVAKRAGNKKVTLVYNVCHYGIVETEFARQLQQLAAASTSVGAAEHRPQGTVQILVQGNATADVAKLLLETYNIPKKYIKGLELIPKDKKSRK